jgi:CHAT domain-containing protein
MFVRTIFVVLCVVISFFLFLSFQNSSKNTALEALKEKALEFESNQQFDSAAIYFAKARTLADKSNVKESRQSVLEAEMFFWVNRSDKKLHEVKKHLHSLWPVYNSDVKFRVNYYDAKSILFLKNSVRDSFDYFFEKTVAELKISKDTKYEITYYSLVAQLFMANDDFFGAKKYVVLAENCIQENPPKNKNDLSGYFFVATEFYTKYGDYEKALRATLNSLEILKNETPDDVVEISNTLNNLGAIYDGLEDFENAEKYYNESLKLSLKFDNNASIGISYNNIGNVALTLNKNNDYKISTEAFKTSLSYSKGNSLIDIQNKIISYQGLTWLYIKQNKLDSAKYYVESLLELQKISNYREEFTYQRIGKIAQMEKDFNRAIYFFEKALGIFRNKLGDKHPDTSWTLNRLAEVFIDQKKYLQASPLLQKAIASNTTEGVDSLNLRQNPDVSKVIDRDLMLYQLNTKIALLDSMRINGLAGIKSLDVYNAAVASVDLILYINQNVQHAASKSYWLNKESVRIFEQAIYYALLVAEEEKNNKYKDQAFLLAEKSKSILLFESRKEKSAARFAGVPDSLTEKENSLKRLFYSLEKKRNNALLEKDSQLISAFDRELLEIQMNIESLRSLLKKSYPEYYRLKYQELNIKPSDITTKLNDSTVILEYFQGKNRSFVFVLRNNAFECHQVLADSTLTNKALNFQKLVADLPYAINSPEEYFRKYSNAALEQYNLWLKPYLKAEDRSKRLVIIADGTLSYLPFEALLTQKPEISNGINYSKLPYLMNDYTVNYNYSAQLWLDHRKPKRQLNGKILAMGPSYTDGENDSTVVYRQLRSEKEVRQRGGVKDLPGASKEISMLKNNYKGKYFDEFDASEKNWKNEASNYGILHFAMHGLLDENEPEFSSLVFSEDGNKEEDNFLYAYEIKELNLNASLAVLSACETGAGMYQGGEGVVSLGRGFMYAGVPSIVMTLWKLNDQSASDLIADFYANLQDGQQKDQALRNAKIKYLEKSNGMAAHPALWACFIQLGDYSAIKIDKIGNFNYLIYVGLFLSAIGVLYFYFRRRKNSNQNKIEF